MSKERQNHEGNEIFSRRLKRQAVEGDRGRRSMLGTGGSSTSTTPCAACKLLRRRCSQECPFSPYFSPQEPQKFACVHKVFGASNVSKMLMEVPESQRADTANSLVYEANVRLRDPIYGCMGIISALQQHAHSLQAELNAVRADILRFRSYQETTVAITYPADQDVRASTQPSDACTATSPTTDYTRLVPSESTRVRGGVGPGYDIKPERFW